MQNEIASKNLNSLFLIEFTKELIRNSNKGIFIELEEKAKYEKQEKEKQEKDLEKKSTKIIHKQIPQNYLIKNKPLIMKKRILTIPKTQLPQHLRYLRPTPSRINIDLKKINPLIKDPRVKSIECKGPNEKIIVKVPFEKTTGISLTEEEIKEIIQTFSQRAKIPIQEGVFKVALGRLILTAITSEIIPTNFTIRKI